MRLVVSTTLGLIGGLLLGFALSDTIAIGAFLLFGGAAWLGFLKFLPLVLGVVGAVAAPAAARNRATGKKVA